MLEGKKCDYIRVIFTPIPKFFRIKLELLGTNCDELEDKLYLHPKNLQNIIRISVTSLQVLHQFYLFLYMIKCYQPSSEAKKSQGQGEVKTTMSKET